MPENLEHLPTLLAELEDERTDLLRTDPYSERRQVIGRLIYRIRVAMLAHETIIPSDLQQHPDVVRLREKIRHDTRRG